MSPSLLAHPEWLTPALATVAGCSLLLGGAWLVKRRRLARLFGARFVGPPTRRGGDLALLVALALLGAAWLGPRLGERTVWIDAAGADLVLLLDVSRSMDARDHPPSRLVRARQAADRLLAGLGAGDRVALAAFASRGVLLTPLTPDVQALREMLPGLNEALVSRRGSDLAAGVRAALQAFPEESLRPRVLVVLSDGEDPQRRREVAAAEAARRGVRVVTVAFGSEGGAALPDEGVPLRDAEGRVVISRRDAARLGRLSEATDGVLLLADRWGDVEQARLLAEVHRDAAGASGEPVARRVVAIAVAPFVVPAFALLWLELAGLPRRRGRLATAAALLALTLLPQAGGAQPARDELPDAWKAVRRPAPESRLLLARGLELARAGKLDAARHALLGAALRARDPALAALAYYDLGVVSLASGALGAARDAFFDALALAPQDAEARFNLEWTLRAIREQEEQRSAEHDAEPGGEPEPEVAPLPLPSAPFPPEAPPETASDAEARLPTLTAEEVARWLDAVEDDPLASLRRTGGDGPGGPRGGAW